MSSNEEEDELFGNQSSDDDHANDRLVNPQAATASETRLLDGLARHEMISNEENFRNMGYLEAYDAAKDERLQEGFEVGYGEMLERATRIGRMLGQATSRVVAASTCTSSIGNEAPPSHQDEDGQNRIARTVRAFLDEQQGEGVGDLLAKIDELEQTLEKLLSIGVGIEDK